MTKKRHLRQGNHVYKMSGLWEDLGTSITEEKSWACPQVGVCYFPSLLSSPLSCIMGSILLEASFILLSTSKFGNAVHDFWLGSQACTLLPYRIGQWVTPSQRYAMESKCLLMLIETDTCAWISSNNDDRMNTCEKLSWETGDCWWNTFTIWLGCPRQNHRLSR